MDSNVNQIGGNNTDKKKSLVLETNRNIAYEHNQMRSSLNIGIRHTHRVERQGNDVQITWSEEHV